VSSAAATTRIAIILVFLRLPGIGQLSQIFLPTKIRNEKPKFNAEDA